MKYVIEASYPSSFRQKEASELDKHIKNHHSVVLIGMKRVGISNFLRFFLNHEKIADTYIQDEIKPIFVQVDLNDLIERNLSAFWTLLLTRIVDAVQYSAIAETDKSKARRLFVQSIQLKDHFFTLESVRKTLGMLAENGLSPVLFLLRFDRLSEVVTAEFFSNLVGLRDSLKGKMSYVFTSFRPLDQLAPSVFTRQHLNLFSRDMYLPPTSSADMDSILSTLEAEYHVTFTESTRRALLDIAGGYVQYMQLATILLHTTKDIPESKNELLNLLTRDEQIMLQSEELFESLTKKEKEVLLSITQGNAPSEENRKIAEYLWNTGMLKDTGKTLFSPLFDEYVSRLSVTPGNGKEFTKKEHLLFSFLESRLDQLCEREAIIEAVWPEHKELGVSDWAIDRLIARLRSKLKASASPYAIVTIVTRGYKLVKT